VKGRGGSDRNGHSQSLGPIMNKVRKSATTACNFLPPEIILELSFHKESSCQRPLCRILPTFLPTIIPARWKYGCDNVRISIVKSTRCRIFRVYWISLYMFRTVFPSIIRSPRLYTQHQVYVIQVRWLLASGPEVELVPSSISGPLASSQRTCMTHTWCCVYSLGLLMMDGKTVLAGLRWNSFRVPSRAR